MVGSDVSCDVIESRLAAHWRVVRVQPLLSTSRLASLSLSLSMRLYMPLSLSVCPSVCVSPTPLYVIATGAGKMTSFNEVKSNKQ